DLGNNAKRLKFVAHLLALLKRPVRTAVDEQHRRAARIDMSNRRSLPPNFRLVLERAADESGVRIKLSPALFFYVAGIDEGRRPVNVDHGLDRARDAAVIPFPFEVRH